MTTLPTIECPQCGLVSAHPMDIAHKYCGGCHQWHDQMKCPCGKPLEGHYTSDQAKSFTQEVVRVNGPIIAVTVGDVTVDVPRHFVALHGFKFEDVETYGFPPHT